MYIQSKRYRQYAPNVVHGISRLLGLLFCIATSALTHHSKWRYIDLKGQSRKKKTLTQPTIFNVNYSNGSAIYNLYLSSTIQIDIVLIILLTFSSAFHSFCNTCFYWKIEIKLLFATRTLLLIYVSSSSSACILYGEVKTSKNVVGMTRFWVAYWMTHCADATH